MLSYPSQFQSHNSETKEIDASQFVLAAASDKSIIQEDYDNFVVQSKSKYNDERMNKVLQVYIKNPQILINREREIKERFLTKQKNEITSTKQKYDTRMKQQQQNNNNENNLKPYTTPLDDALNQLNKQKKQMNNVLVDNSNKYRQSFQLNNITTPVSSNNQRKSTVDFSKKNMEFLENLQDNISRKKQDQQIQKKKKHDEQQQMKAESQLSQIQSRLYEQTELQKLRQNQKKEEEIQKRQPNKSLSIEINNGQQCDVNQKIIDRQKEYLKKLKLQVQNERDVQYLIQMKNEEEKKRVKNNVLATIKNELNEERRLTLDNHNLFLSKSTVSQSAKQNKAEIKVDDGAEKRKVATSQLFFRSTSKSSKRETGYNSNEGDMKKSTTDLSKIKKLRPLPFISNMKDWKKKQRIPAESKIFIVMGGYKDFKKALLKRGWIENPQTNSPCFDLKWTLLGKDIDYDNILPNQIVNHFEKNTHISSKIGLMNSLKNLIWFDSADTNTFFPQCFDMNDPDEFNQFVKTFKLSKAESILKKYLRLYLENSDQRNQIRLQAQVALSVLTRYNKHIDLVIDDEKESIEYFKAIPDEEWDILASDEMSSEDLTRKKHFDWIKKIKLAYQGIKVKAQVKKKRRKSQEVIKKIIQNDAIKRKQNKKEVQDSEDEEEEVEMDDFTSAVNQYLKESETNDAQYNLKGEDNIWIVKPAGLSRGRGITCYKNLVEIIDHAKSMELQMVVQKYIESPILVKQKKFDIRIWVLVTDWNPLAIWYFDESYVRFSADNYSTKNLSNKFQHLTNNAISKKKTQIGEDEITKQGNMYTQEQLENFFIEQEGYNVFQEQIKPKIFEIIKWSLLSCCDSIESRKNSMELFGYDIMVDTSFNPWLLEVNTSPSLEYSTINPSLSKQNKKQDITKKLVKQVLEDVAKVVVDYGLAQKSGAKKSELSKINTGKFIRIYQGQEIQDKGINSLGKNFICEGVKMKIRKQKKSKKIKTLQSQKSNEIKEKNNNNSNNSNINSMNNTKNQNQLINTQVFQQEIQTQKKQQQSRPQTAQSQKSSSSKI